MKKILNVNKPIGWTLLVTILKIKELYPQYQTKSVTYAGRLDPLAHGVLLLLVDDEIKNKQKYLQLNKTYEFTVLFGVNTDTFDILGLLQQDNLNVLPANLEQLINKYTQTKIGKQLAEYPPYSSKTVQGKSLIWWAKQNKLSQIKIPKKEIEIHQFDLLSIDTHFTETIKSLVFDKIHQVAGDFRQDEILKKWNNFFKKQHTRFSIAKFRIKCSSGTYIRAIADDLGKYLGGVSLALDIFRTAVGKYQIKDSLKLVK